MVPEDCTRTRPDCDKQPREESLMCTRKRENKPGCIGSSRFVWPLLVVALAIGNLFASAQTAHAQSCVGEISGFKAQCTANDVALTDIVPGSVVILDDGCTSTADTVTFKAQGIFTLTTNERFDIGVFIGTDGDPNGDGAKSGQCSRFSLANTPDPPYVSLDGDACGDIDASHSPLTQTATSPLGPVTIKCVDNDGDGKVDLIHCETWNQPGADTVCTGANDIKAGSPSKCNCGTLPSFCIAVPDNNECTRDVCAGTCSGSGALCESNNDCSAGQTCQNIAPQHLPVAAGTSCGNAPSGACDAQDVCNAAGQCVPTFQPATTQCRASAGVCDVAESCTGSSAACPSDGFVAATTTCRASAGVCDVAESCTGGSAACPSDGFVAATTTCRASAGDCDVAESCSGSSAACPAEGFKSATTTCRASTGTCDAAESCTGASAACPADVGGKVGDVCRAAKGDCDVAEVCDASKNCPADGFKAATTECRASAGVCDVAESCTGKDAACPVDGYLSATSPCRPSAGVCDVAESCSGKDAACPKDEFQVATTECRAAKGDCDVAESCSGSGAACPADGFKTATTTCRPAAGTCDVAESCSGKDGECPADVGGKVGEICRPAKGDCDVAEVCDASKNCPADSFKPLTTECRAAKDDCDVAESCSGKDGACPIDGFKAATTTCRASAGVCDVAESCTGKDGACPVNGFAPSTTVCRASTDKDCDPAENCLGKDATCPTNTTKPDGTVCTSDGDQCTDDLCKNGSCAHTPDPSNNPDVCGFACRTPGFWSTHGEITLDLLNLAGGITVCGKPITDIDVGQKDSALEALCVAVQGNQKLQLARQLTSAKLNCLLNSDGTDADCTDAIEAKIKQCDAVCTDSKSLLASVTACISTIDAFNNGISTLALGCHDRALPDPYDPPGSATSSQQCNDARKNQCTIFGGC